VEKLVAMVGREPRSVGGKSCVWAVACGGGWRSRGSGEKPGHQGGGLGLMSARRGR
jgi:hypothetical protein